MVGSIKLESSTMMSGDGGCQQSDMSKIIKDDMDDEIVLVDKANISTLESPSCPKRKPLSDNDVDDDAEMDDRQKASTSSSTSNKRIKIQNDNDDTTTSISTNNVAEIGCDNSNNDDTNVQHDSFEIIDNNDDNSENNVQMKRNYYENLIDNMEQKWLEDFQEYYYIANHLGNYMDYQSIKKRLDPIGLAKQLVYICQSYNDDDENNDDVDYSRRLAECLLKILNPNLHYDDILAMIEHFNATNVTSTALTITPPLTPSAIGSTGAGKCQTSANIINSASDVNEPPPSLSTNQISTMTSLKSEPIHQSSIVSTLNDSSGKNQSSLPLLDNSHVASPKRISNLNDMSNTIINDSNNNNATTIADNSNIKISPLAVAKKLSISSSLDKESSTEQMVERAKKEAYVMKRIAELRKNGVWSIRRLPKVHEPPRCKTHWDYLLEEMQWLAADFFQERKWKRNSAKKCARLALKYHSSKECQAERIEREEQLKLKRIALNMAKMIKQFWSEIEKVVEAKQEVQLNEKRKKIHDMQLRFIVDKADILTEKLAQELVVPAQKTSKASSTCSEADPSETKIDQSSTNKRQKSDVDDHDEEFEQGSICSDDDEETIAKEENDCQHADYTEEVNALSNESEMPIEQLLAKYYNIEADDIDLSQLQKQLHQESTEEEKPLDEAKNEQQQKDDDTTTVDDETENNEDDDDDMETADSDDEISSTKKQQQPEQDDDESMLSEVDDNPEAADDTDDSESDSVSNDDDDDVDSRFLIQQDDKKDDEKAETTDDELNDIAAGAQSIQPKGNTFSSVQVINKVPFLLKYQLREYQHIGLDWLIAMYEKNLNGILADEMGLGKTIQTIALIAHLACEKGIWGPHLIVVPTSVMLNWEMEFKKWCPALKIMTYFGNPKERRLKRKGWTKPDTFHVCITSYKLVIQDHQSFRRQKWVYFILDEAHNIKNFKSQRWQMLLNFNSKNRLLLTGTPLQNNLMELWSLMHFLMPKEFQSHREFKTWFDKPMTGMIEGQNDYNEDLIRRLHRVLRPFLLRRLKRDVEKQLPKKYEHIVRCPLSKRQRFLYDEYMSLANTKETLASGNFLSVINILMQLRKVCNHPNLFELRKTISPFIDNGLRLDLPGMITTINDHDPFKQINLHSHLNLLFSHLLNDSYKQTQTLKRYYDMFKMKDVINKQEDQIYKFSYVINASNNKPLIRSTNNQIRIKSLENSKAHVYINPGSRDSPKIDRDNVSIEIRKCDDESKENRDKFFGNGRFAHEETVHRLKTLFNEKLRRLALNNKSRCQGFARYCTDFFELFDFSGYKGIVNFIPWNKINHENDEDLKMKDSKRLHGSSFINGLTLVRRSQHLKDDEEFNRNDLYYISKNLIELVDSPNSLAKNLEELMKRFIFIIPGVVSPATQFNLSNVKSYKKIDRTNLIEDLREKFPIDKFDLLTIPRVQFSLQLPETRLIQYDCGKLQVLDKLLWQLKSGRHRILIFTQMSRMLDILEQFLNYHGHTYLRLDGTTKIDQRQALMERFNADQRIFCFILSTRSGGIGVNLTGADTVIFYDSDWNPTMDAQAQDRCHRIGQTRDVHIYRLVSERTVEENILKKAKQKKMLGDMAIEEGNFTTAFFKQTAIKELFDVGEQDMGEEPTISEPVEIVETDENSVIDPLTPSSSSANNNIAPPTSSVMTQNAAFEQALCTAEEENDVTAAKIVRAEVAAELDEFDENIPIEDIPDEKSPEEEQIEELICQLTPVERYALKFIESAQDFHELKQAEEEMEETKKQWQKSINEWKKDQEELRKRELEELEDSIMTCSREDGSISKVNHNDQHSRLIHKNTHNNNNDKIAINRRNKFSRNIVTRRSNNNNKNTKNNRNLRKNHVDSSNHHNKNSKNRRRQQPVADVTDDDDDDDDDDGDEELDSEI
ncbi:helicase domino-like protein, partial [Euroglyphus maynei]